MDDKETFAIVGAGMAGAKAALTLREDGFDGSVVLVGAEAHPPYERPPLSKDYLRGESAAADAHVEPEAGYAERGIELLAGVAALSLDVGARRLALADGAVVDYDALLIATGAVPRRLPI